jgi:hypothetical protein
MPLKRTDSEGRDVTDSPGLWDEMDTVNADDAYDEISRLSFDRRSAIARMREFLKTEINLAEK